MKVESVLRMWLDFWKAIAPPDAPSIQKQEMRRAFYGGCWAMLMAMRGLGGPEFSEDEGVAILERYKVELEGFVRNMNTGIT